MRLLHTSDWHLGRHTYRVPRAPDHDAVIDEIVAIAQDARPHLIVHSGDLWDVLRPGYDDLQRGVDALRRLAEVAPVLVVCGNHDSPALFRVFARLHGLDRTLGPGAIAFAADGSPQPYEAAGEDGERVRVAVLPFVHQNRAVQAFETDPGQWGAAYLDRLRRIWEILDRGLATGADPRRDVRLLACHTHLEGAVFAKSERAVHVQDAYAGRAEHIPVVDYCAFGHIHRPQALPRGLGRYAGSPIPLDFGEEGEAKQVVLVEARPGERARVSPVPLSAGRPLLLVTGTLDRVAAQAHAADGALCRVVVTSAAPVPDVADRVREALPGAVILEVQNQAAGERLQVVRERDAGEGGEPGLDELFRGYLAERGTPGAEADRVLRTFRALWRAAEEEAPPRLEALDALRGGDA